MGARSASISSRVKVPLCESGDAARVFEDILRRAAFRKRYLDPFGQKREFGQRLGRFAQIHAMIFQDFVLDVAGNRLIGNHPRPDGVSPPVESTSNTPSLILNSEMSNVPPPKS